MSDVDRALRRMYLYFAGRLSVFGKDPGPFRLLAEPVPPWVYDAGQAEGWIDDKGDLTPKWRGFLKKARKL